MFERAKVDNTHELHGVSVEIELDSGATLKGRFAIPMSKSVYDVLNGQGNFVEFEPFDGDRRMLAKSTLRSVRLMNPPKASDLGRRLRDMDSFDPHTILGLKPGCPWDDIRSAYHRLAKAYHPDLYASADLPAEVRDYLSGMARRVNAAYAALESAPQIKHPPVRNEPVYSRAAR